MESARHTFPVYADSTTALALIPASAIKQYSTGTTSIVSTSIVIPPKDGIAMGTIMSEPRPVEVSTGIRARMVVAVVIRHGLIRRTPAPYRPVLKPHERPISVTLLE